MQSADATIVDPIATQTWGMRECSVADRDGHMLRIGHVVEGAADYGSFSS